MCCICMWVCVTKIFGPLAVQVKQESYPPAPAWQARRQEQDTAVRQRAFGSLVAITSTWQRRRMKLVNIYEGMKIYLLFTHTNRVEGACVSDAAIIPANWYRDVVKLSGKVSETEDRWANTVSHWSWTHKLKHSPEYTPTFSRVHKKTQKHSTYMDDWARFTYGFAFSCENRMQKRGTMTCHRLWCGPEFIMTNSARQPTQR